MVRTRWFLLAGLLVVAVVVALVVPLPSPLAMRDTAAGWGTLAPLAFLLLHTLVTVTPLPRTAFTLSAGLLFGPAVGLAVCLVASTLSAAIGFAIARRLGERSTRAAIERIGPGRLRTLDARLRARGLLTVLSTRLVPAIPFAPLNYTLAVTGVRWWPFTLGTAVGLVPGTAAVVLLGDAVTGRPSPAMLAVFLVSGAIGVLGLVLSARRGRAADEPAPDPA